MADSMRIHALFIDAHKHTVAAKQQALCLMKSEIKECETVIYIKEKIEIEKNNNNKRKMAKICEYWRVKMVWWYKQKERTLMKHIHNRTKQNKKKSNKRTRTAREWNEMKANRRVSEENEWMKIKIYMRLTWF